MNSDKTSILAEIRRLAKEAGGAPPGQIRFTQATGITLGMWRGKFWRTWSDALREAGFAPNVPLEAYAKNEVVEWLTKLTVKLGHFPTFADQRLAKQSDPACPSETVFRKLGTRASQIELVRD
jgi:hypothetical protein